jgi:hypothetical protein
MKIIPKHIRFNAMNFRPTNHSVSNNIHISQIVNVYLSNIAKLSNIMIAFIRPGLIGPIGCLFRIKLLNGKKYGREDKNGNPILRFRDNIK